MEFSELQYSGWEFSSWKFSRWELSWVRIFGVGVILGGNFLWWRFSGWELSVGNHPGGSFLGGSFPSTLWCTKTNFSHKKLYSSFHVLNFLLVQAVVKLRNSRIFGNFQLWDRPNYSNFFQVFGPIFE